MPLDPDQEREATRWRRASRSLPRRIEPPGPGQESVWDYPRPPHIESVPQVVRVALGRRELAESGRALRVLETASPPTYYVPIADVDAACLEPVTGATLCEWKGLARYYDVRADGHAVRRAAWGYPEPLPAFEALRGLVSFFPGRVACFVGDERVRPQPGGYYGGWITRNLAGPFKGEPGSERW